MSSLIPRHAEQPYTVILWLQMFIGDGAKLVRDAFALAKEKSPCIIFIDEIDAIGTKRFDSEVSGDREVQRTMLELLNQLDGFSSDDNIKVAAWMRKDFFLQRGLNTCTSVCQLFPRSEIQDASRLSRLSACSLCPPGDIGV